MSVSPTPSMTPPITPPSFVDGKASPLHRGPHENKDLGFSVQDRHTLGLRGLLPNVHESLEAQTNRALHQLRSKSNGLEKYIYLSNIRQTNSRLFYKLVMEHMGELTPLIYTPTVGEACEKFSEIYRRPEGLYISLEDKGSIKSVLENWPHKERARVAVVTDGSRILGLGDLGVGGLGIPIGKLSLYIGGAGIDPQSTVPIVLDMGTDNPRLLADPFYLGLRQVRQSIAQNEEFLDEFVHAVTEVFPKVKLQFEDFSSEAAFHYLERYRHTHLVWNDDIQGTGAVILSGFINAVRQAVKASGRPLADQKIVFLGAGSAAVGVAQQLQSFFTRNGLTIEQAKERFWLVDTKGLITADRGDKLASHKEYFKRTDNAGKQFKTLEEVVDYVEPTALIGLSTSKGAFTKPIVEKMAKLNPLPIIFPLSNPTEKCEATFQDALDWSNGTAIYASGSPYDPVEFNGVTRYAGQGNNMYIFPSLGLGTILSGATRVTDRMIEETSLALSQSLTADETAASLIYPRIERIMSISAEIAVKVIRAAQFENLDTNKKLRALSDAELLEFVRSKQYCPSYSEDTTPAYL
ncbi:hypothetical protein BDY24DRAFT_397543 [Mrakia frigida]|uniref:uncharacterized protein n=1 Tax=Mrakia frigida TaxID=29902 RepID=UPI003FCC1F9C